MAEYIDRNLIEWYGCDYEKDPDCENRECSSCSHAKGSHAQVMQIPTADVIERSKYDNLHNLAKSWLEEKKELEKANVELRSKIDKAIDEIEDLGKEMDKVQFTKYLVPLGDILEIIKRNIGE